MSETTLPLETAAEATDLDDSDVHRLLADRQRRTVVTVLRDSTAVTRSELATAVADRERGDGDATTERVETRLHHVHLPVLDEAGVVNYDPEAELVEPLPSLQTLRR